MKLFKKRRGYWPMGERFAAFFRGPTVAPENVRVEIRDNRPLNVSPTGRALEPLYSAPYGSTARLLEESAWLGVQMEAAWLRVQTAQRTATVTGRWSGTEPNIREEIRTIPFKEPSAELMSQLADIERAREDFWKMAEVNNLNTLKGIGEMPSDYFKCEKPT